MTNQMAISLLCPTVWPNMEMRAFRLSTPDPTVHPDLLQSVRDCFLLVYRVPQQLRDQIAPGIMGTAYFIKEMTSGSGATQQLYRLSGPLEDQAEYVVVSAVMAMIGGPETYIFRADPEGNVICWSELSGSLHGALDHQKALREAGCRVVRP